VAEAVFSNPDYRLRLVTDFYERYLHLPADDRSN